MSNLTAEPIAWAHHSTFNNLDNFDKSRFTATLSKKETNACCIPLFTNTQRTWVGLMRGVRVEGDTVVISVKGGNDAARELCGALIEEMNR